MSAYHTTTLRLRNGKSMIRHHPVSKARPAPVMIPPPSSSAAFQPKPQPPVIPNLKDQKTPSPELSKTPTPSSASSSSSSSSVSNGSVFNLMKEMNEQSKKKKEPQPNPQPKPQQQPQVRSPDASPLETPVRLKQQPQQNEAELTPDEGASVSAAALQAEKKWIELIKTEGKWLYYDEKDYNREKGGRFKLIEHLSRLTFVYKDVLQNVDYVAKFHGWYPDTDNTDVEEAQQCTREFDALAKMGSPYVPQLFGVLTCHRIGTEYFSIILMERMACDLDRLLRNPTITLQLHHIQLHMYQLLQCISRAHKLNILHRDIKPQNIFLNHNGIGIRLGDWESSRFVDPNAVLQYGSSKLERNKDILSIANGSPISKMTEGLTTRWYRSPETLFKDPYGEAADIWSAACIFYEETVRQPFLKSEDDDDAKAMILDLYPSDITNEISEDMLPPDYEYDSQFRNQRYGLWPKHDVLGLDLFTKMTNLDKDTRLTADECLMHPYFDSLRASILSRAVLQGGVTNIAVADTTPPSIFILSSPPPSSSAGNTALVKKDGFVSPPVSAPPPPVQQHPQQQQRQPTNHKPNTAEPMNTNA